MNVQVPRPGDIVVVSAAASWQFRERFRFRVARVDQRSTPPGWAWLDGHRISPSDEVGQERSIYVRLDGLI